MDFLPFLLSDRVGLTTLSPTHFREHMNSYAKIYRSQSHRVQRDDGGGALLRCSHIGCRVADVPS